MRRNNSGAGDIRAGCLVLLVECLRSPQEAGSCKWKYARLRPEASKRNSFLEGLKGGEVFPTFFRAHSI
jgi:hypothetical protein